MDASGTVNGLNGYSSKNKYIQNHSSKNEHGNHEHIIQKKSKIIKGKKIVVDVKKIKYIIPAAEFDDRNNWTSGSFYYETGVKTLNGISGTISAGKSIFWKITTTRLTKPKS